MEASDPIFQEVSGLIGGMLDTHLADGFPVVGVLLQPPGALGGVRGLPRSDRVSLLGETAQAVLRAAVRHLCSPLLLARVPRDAARAAGAVSAGARHRQPAVPAL